MTDFGTAVPAANFFKIVPPRQMNYLPLVCESTQLFQQLAHCFVNIFRAARCAGYK
jgi:hypothetical protein